MAGGRTGRKLSLTTVSATNSLNSLSSLSRPPRLACCCCFLPQGAIVKICENFNSWCPTTTKAKQFSSSTTRFLAARRGPLEAELVITPLNLFLPSRLSNLPHQTSTLIKATDPILLGLGLSRYMLLLCHFVVADSWSTKKDYHLDISF